MNINRSPEYEKCILTKGTFVRVNGTLKNKCTGSWTISVPSHAVRKQPRSKYLKQFKMNLNDFRTV